MGEFLELADRDIDAAAAYVRQWPENLNRGQGGESLLHALAIEDCREAVEALIRAGADLRDPIDWFTTPVFDVATLGYAEMLALLLRHGCDPNTRSETLGTALSQAVGYGHVECVRLLLDAGARVEEGDDVDGPPLHVAVTSDRTEIARMLLDAGADANSTETYFGNAALHCAASAGNVPMARLLLERGAVPTFANKAGETPIDLAIAAGHDELALLLLGGRGAPQ
jgi:ankyrin repeat protein